MITLGRALLVMGLAGAVFAGCFTDQDKLGPRSYLILDRSAVTLTTGASATVAVTLRDGDGRLTPVTDLLWLAVDSTVATVVPDTVAVPGSYEARASIVGRTTTGGWTRVIVSAAGRSDTLPVAVLPARFLSSLVSYAGTPRPDTVIRPALLGPPYVPPDTLTFTAPDTLVLTSTGALQFDTGSAYVYVLSAGTKAWGTVTSVTTSRLVAVLTRPALGQLVIHRLNVVAGPATIAIDSLLGDSVAVSRQRFGGTVAVVGDTMTLTAGPGTLFDSYAGVSFDTLTAAVIGQTSSQLRVLSPVAYSGYVTVRALRVRRSGPGYGYMDSVKTAARYAIAAATFPGRIVTRGRLLDTVTVYAAPYTRFGADGYYEVSVPASYPCTGCRYGVMWISLTPDSLRFVSPVATNGPILIGKWVDGWAYGGVAVGSLNLAMYSRDTLIVSGSVTGEPNEPGNDSATGATPVTLGRYFFGALNGTTDTTDWYAFPVSGTSYVYLSAFNYPGTGVGGVANPHFSAYVCDSLAGGVCANEHDLAAGRVLVRAGTVWLRVAMRTPEPGYVAYRCYLSTSTSAVRQAASPPRSRRP